MAVVDVTAVVNGGLVLAAAVGEYGRRVGPLDRCRRQVGTNLTTTWPRRSTSRRSSAAHAASSG
ncbi:hypothetical protein ACWCOT_42050 [Nonomuraea bangladeshensis]